MWAYRAATVVFAGLVIGACNGSRSATSRVERDGLIIEFTPVCIDREVKLLGAIVNTGAQSIQIESGALPWQYDLLGTDFQAESAGTKLAKNSATPLIGKTGPKMLAPTERREGITPIAFIFPELRSLLARQPVTVTWAYPLILPRDAKDQIRGRVEITKDPCDG